MTSGFIDGISKGLAKESISTELPAGSPRRYEPALGLKKHNERIHRESKAADNKNLPFTFKKAAKPLGRSSYIKCNNCGHISVATTATVGIICNECKKFSTVSEVDYDE